jgi:hypothetical protein
MNARMHEFATWPALLRRAIEFHQNWIETTLGVAPRRCRDFQADLNLGQIGLEKILACSSRPDASSRAVRRLAHSSVRRYSPGFPLLVELNKLPHKS